MSAAADAASHTPDDQGPDSPSRDVALACARLALERKARDVKVYCVGDRLGIAEYFILATVNNRRQARAVRDEIRVGLKELGAGVPASASEDPEGRWSLYDYGGVVLHLFDDEGRRFFDLDALWEDVPTLDVSQLERAAKSQPYSDGLSAEPTNAPSEDQP